MKNASLFILSLSLIIVCFACSGTVDTSGSSGSSNEQAVTPPAPVFAAIINNDYYKSPPVLEWDSYSGSTDSALLSRDGGPAVSVSRGDAPSENGEYTLSVTRTHNSDSSLTASSTVSFTIDNSSPALKVPTNTLENGTVLEVDFRPSGTFTAQRSPTYVFWIEDMQGNFIQDLFVCNVPATNVMRFNNAFVCRPEALPYWMHKAGAPDPYRNVADKPARYQDELYLAYPSSEAGDPIPADLDAVTQATLYSDFLVETKRKDDGLTRFRVLFEVNKSSDTNSYFNDTLSNDIYYSYDPGQPSVVYGVDIDLSSGKKDYTMRVIGTGHFAGRDGELYSAENHTTALELVRRIVVSIK